LSRLENPALFRRCANPWVKRILNVIRLSALLLFIVGPALADDTIIDLTHAFDSETVYWPTASGFELSSDFKGGSGGPLRIVAVVK